MAANTMIRIMGANWQIQLTAQGEDASLANADGYTDWTRRTIVVCDIQPEPGSWGNLTAYKKKVLRHEIIHAFLFECGLAQETKSCDAWASNEEMVDWFAFNGPKIYAAWKEADALG